MPTYLEATIGRKVRYIRFFNEIHCAGKNPMGTDVDFVVTLRAWVPMIPLSDIYQKGSFDAFSQPSRVLLSIAKTLRIVKFLNHLWQFSRINFHPNDSNLRVDHEP
ncbi:MAG: hypothetical protein KC643_26030 [Nitrospira sp.]|nr:hypothetical protein [Nitrospira sp.]MCA9479650.1 hypothetical protein [Nitrospira sp.]